MSLIDSTFSVINRRRKTPATEKKVAIWDMGDA
jgi:hypothetical protein